MNEERFKVVIHTYTGTFGWVAYDGSQHKITVSLDDKDKKEAVENYLSSRHVIRTAQGDLRAFKEVDILPADSLENFKLALTRMWEATGVCVAWSRPVDND